MVIKNNILYVGGNFSQIANQSRKGLAAFDIRTGALLDWNPFYERATLSSLVITALSCGDTTLYVGGTSRFVDNVSRPFLAEFSLQTGVATAWKATIKDCFVSAIVTMPRGLAVCGSFISGGAYLTLFDRSNGSVLDSSIRGDNRIRTMALQDSILYFGGDFTTINNTPRSRLASLHLPTGKLTNWSPYANREVFCLSAVGSQIYAGGRFTVCGLPTIYRKNLAAIDTRSGEVLPWNPTLNDVTNSDNTAVNALQLAPTRLYVGGKFSTMSGRPRQSLAAFDVQSGGIVESFRSPLARNSQVHSFAFDNNRLFIGGAGFIYQLDAANGSPTYISDTSVYGQIRQYLWEVGTQYVHTLAIQNRILYAGGGFFDLSTSRYLRRESRPSLAAIDIDSLKIKDWDPNLQPAGSSLDYEYGAHYNTYVGKIDIQNDIAYVAGGFRIPSSRGIRGLAAIDILTAKSRSWSPIDSAQTAINKSKGSTDSVFVGGKSLIFNNGLIYLGLIAFDTATGAKEVWRAETMQDVSIINTILVHNNVVYVGGYGLAAFKAYSKPVTTSVARAQEPLSGTPPLSIYPNPTSGVAIASYLLPAPCRVRLELFDVMGRSVRVCVQEAQTAGEHTALIQTSDLPAGVYFLVLESASGKSMQRLVVGR